MNLHGARVLVAGASGQLGRYLLPRLLDAGAQVLAVSRHRPAWAHSLPLDWLEQSITTLSELELLTCQAMVWNAPLNLFEEFANQRNFGAIERVLAFSSTSVLTKRASPSAAERQLSELIARSEAALITGCETVGVKWTLLRPTLIYGGGADQNISRLRALIRRWGFLPLPIACHGLRQPVHADDLAHAALQCLRSSRSTKRCYELVGGQTLSYRMMVERLFHCEGREPRILLLPRWLLAIVLRLRGEDPAMLARMAQDLVFDSTPAADDFGYQARPFKP